MLHFNNRYSPPTGKNTMRATIHNGKEECIKKTVTSSWKKEYTKLINKWGIFFSLARS